MKPRDFALRELDAKRLPHWPAGALKNSKPLAPPADPRDLALAEHITIGVVKNLLQLQHLIQHYSGRSDGCVVADVRVRAADLRIRIDAKFADKESDGGSESCRRDGE